MALTQTAPVVLLAESGADIPEAARRSLGIEVVPMHVTLAGETFDDGAVTSAQMLATCAETGAVPTTSGCTPHDFTVAFDRIHAEHPDARILHLAYSAATTCSYDSALTAAEGRDYVTSVDVKSVTCAQYLVVSEVARFLRDNPDATVDDAADLARDLSGRIRLGFIPGDLAFLRAGGRLSNAAYLGAHLLRIKPTVEMVDGRLVATKKRRGSMARACRAFLDDFLSREGLDRSRLAFVYSSGLSDEIRAEAEARVREAGFQEVEWVETGCVIASHSGPGSFGAAAIAER